MAFEGILINGTSEILKKLITVIGSEISLDAGVKDELKRLKQTLEVIAAVTSDAERKQMNDAAVLLWLKRLKEVSYDADDVLDETSYEAMRRSDKNSKVKDFFSSSNQVAFRLKMAHKIKGINTQFKQIATDMQRFQFQTNSNDSRGGYEQHKQLTISFFGDASKFVGRNEDNIKTISMLTTTGILSSSMSLKSSSVNPNQLENVTVISIVGMGGLGKTSLAQSIYNDKSVENQFVIKMWVCISDDFDVFKILKNIMESVTRSRCEDFSNIDVLVKQLREELQGTKYLLVLDDLWNEDPMEWNKLKGVLDCCGSVGSKIIVTTRSQTVALVVGGLIPPYNLNVLSQAECWSIIKNKAFSPGGHLRLQI
ncbi:putative disease resistance protein RGA3 [Papaver somniferum]|uniref:putative disease resistance protein RGA3 n=1 Tax=Papaver somniferum TaxID=3469 RepID=UPI000E6FDA53|nr:putative disease resistance protein RGA3 [Papaver somniferum]